MKIKLKRLCTSPVRSTMGNAISRNSCFSKLSLHPRPETGAAKEIIVEIPAAGPLFPDEIIIEILSWLPAKSLLRMKCVCKQWYSLTQDRSLVEKHMNRATTLYSWTWNGIVDRDTNNPARESFKVICGCNGLLLRRSNNSKKYHIRNPTTRQRLDLPDPHNGSFGITFSFIPSTGDYKLVSVFDDIKQRGSERCEVITLGIDNSWRSLKVPNFNNPNKKREKITVVSAGSAVHWIREIKAGPRIFPELLVSLDLETECFRSSPLPQGLSSNWEKVWAIDWNGNLSSNWEKVWAIDWNGNLSFGRIVEGHLNVMVLEDYKNQKWGERKVIIPLAFMKKVEDMVEDIFPLFARRGDLCVLLREKEVVTYNIESGKIKSTLPIPEGSKVLRHGFSCYHPSLVSFKGMKPELG